MTQTTERAAPLIFSPHQRPERLLRLRARARQVLRARRAQRQERPPVPCRLLLRQQRRRLLRPRLRLPP